MDIEVYSKDFSKDILWTPTTFTTPQMSVKTNVNLSGDLNNTDYNLLRDRLLQSLRDKKLAEKLAADLNQLVKDADLDVAVFLVDAPDGAPTRLERLKKDAEKRIKEFEGEVSKLFTDSWNTFVKDHQAYKTYKIKIGIDVAVATISIGGSVASLATSATPLAPVTLVMGLYGIIKNTAKLVVVIRNAVIEAETVAKDLTKNCADLKVKLEKLVKLDEEQQKKIEQAKKGKTETEKEVKKLEEEMKDIKKKTEAAKKLIKAKEKLKEFFVALGNKLSGDVVGVKVATVEGIASKASLYGNKCRGIQETTRKIASDYMQSIEKMLELGQYCDKLEQHFVARAQVLDFSPKAKAEIVKMSSKIQIARKAWMGMQDTMKKLNDDVGKSETRYQENVEKSKKFSETTKKAQEAFKTSNWAEAGRWCGVAIDVGLTAGANGASNWANTEKAVTTSMKLLTIFEKEAITELKKKM
jgi:hypothetical protein